MLSWTKGWNCPYSYCGMSSNTRHLERKHFGAGMPLNQIDFTTKMYKESASRERSLSPIAIASAIAAASLSSSQKHGKNHNHVDHVLRPLRKAAEFKNLLSEISPRSQGIPIPSSSYAACNRLSAYSNPAYSQSLGSSAVVYCRRKQKTKLL